MFIRGDTTPRTTSLNLSMPYTHGTLSLTPSLLFIRPRTNQRPRLRPKAQYIVLGPYPYNIYFCINLKKNCNFLFSNIIKKKKKGITWTFLYVGFDEEFVL